MQMMGRQHVYDDISQVIGSNSLLPKNIYGNLHDPPSECINRWSGIEVGLAHLGAPNLPIIVGLASLLLSNRQETPVREPAISCQR